MSMKYKDITEPKREFYCYLGLLSTKFAIMESHITTILGLLIIDDFVLTSTLFERNNLQQNIDFLKKISKHRDYEVEIINSIIRSIGNIKDKRNLFIHGIWEEPYEFENDIIIKCLEPRLDHRIETRNGSTFKTTTSHKTHEFRLTYIKKLVRDINDIIIAQEAAIKRLKNFDFDF